MTTHDQTPLGCPRCHSEAERLAFFRTLCVAVIGIGGLLTVTYGVLGAWFEVIVMGVIIAATLVFRVAASSSNLGRIQKYFVATFLLWVVATCLMSGGIRSPAVGGIYLVLLLAAIFLSRRDAFVFTVLSGLSVALLFGMRKAGIEFHHYGMRNSTLIDYSPFFAVGAGSFVAVWMFRARIEKISQLISQENERARSRAQEISEVLEMYSNLEFSSRAPVKGEDEVFDRIGTGINQMIEHVLQQQAAITAASKLSALGEMAAGIAHEVNTPLTVIKGHAEMIRDCVLREAPDRERILKSAEKTIDTVDRIAKVIRNLRKLARDGASDPVAEVRAEALVGGVFDLCESKIRRRGVELSYELSEPAMVIHCREVQISQALLNLVQNAFDAVKDTEGAWIRVTVARHSGHIEIAVTDSGSGISDEVAEKLMQPFFTTKPVGEGTGLGLSVSRTILASHQGELRLDRTSPNTRFVMKIPHELEA